MGPGASEGTEPVPGLSSTFPAPYLLAYDAEHAGCRRFVDWIQRRDTGGLVVSFPFQNAELVHVAPELAGLPEAGQVYGFDTRTRQVHGGARLLPSLLSRLPRWRWLAPLAVLAPMSTLFYAYLRRGGK